MPERTTPIPNVASHRVAALLREQILSGKMPPGARVMQEEVAASLGSSRLPVREALRILEAEGLLVLKPNSGAWVSKLDLAECVDTYKIRERLEPLALAESIPHLTDAQIDRLDEIEDKIEQSTDIEGFLTLDRELHLATYAGCPIEQLSSMIHRFWNTTQHYRRAYARLTTATGSQLVHYEHRLLIDAVRRRDAPDAERLLTGHIRRTRLALAGHPELFTQAESPGERRRAE
ncbi:GntR family transcriptional regulator [Streptomyces sp. NPDC055692]|uniref:GntR family transcriptional regulator n=1 Tax=Streptomyces sp. NPDC055692 TaxID=3155683 RepID=UPI00341E51D5